MNVTARLLASAAILLVIAAAPPDDLVWKQALPGSHAFLGDDGGGVETATACDTIKEYGQWLH